jgi:hypothetical protein
MNKDYEDLNDYRDSLEKYINDYNQLDKQKFKKHNYDDDLFERFFPDKYQDEYNKYINKHLDAKKWDNLYNNHPDKGPQKGAPLDIKKDQWYQGVTPHQFKVGDLVRANANYPGLDNNHPDWSEARLNLLGGIIISTESPTADGGDWSVSFYLVLWPSGAVDEVSQDWIELYV